MKNINIARILTVSISALAIGGAVSVQLFGQGKLAARCSYLDPVTIDVFAFAAAFFLVVEGITKIEINKEDRWRKQALRAIRVAFGFSIISLHIIQLIHK
ncbi:MAG: hypothetical protein Q8Q23_04495 [bacterium]|nr:hypothetical protein [bacterium]